MDKYTINQNIINKVKRFGRAVEESYQVQFMVVFGSQAKGTAHKYSDIDVCVVSNHFPQNTIEVRKNLTKLARQIDERIEVHPMRTEDYNNRYYTFAKEIRTHGVEVAV